MTIMENDLENDHFDLEQIWKSMEFQSGNCAATLLLQYKLKPLMKDLY